jgi:CHAT domain-containing protein/predicted negative regulator of RcsB-dependent stress response
MFKLVLLIVISFGFCLTAPGQNPSSADSPKADDVLEAAKKIYNEDGPSKALPEYERALSLFQKEGNRKGEAITIGLMGNAYKKLGQQAKALDFLQRALAMKRELGDRLEEGKTLSNLGLFYWNASDYPKAIEYYNQASVVAKELGNKNLEATIHNNTGLVYDDIGDARSIDEYRQAIELYGSEPSIPLANAIGNLGGWHLLHGKYAEALGYYQRALAIDEQLKAKYSIAVDLQNIGLSLVGLGKSQEALRQLDRGITLAHEGGFVKEEADSRKAKASALLQLGRYTEALQQYNLAIQVYQQAGFNGEPEFKQNLVEALGDLGNLEIRLGDIASAEKDFRRAIDLAEDIKHPRGVTVNLISLGDVQFRQKRFSEAAAFYNQALSRATSAEDKANAALAQVQLSHDYRNLNKLDEAEVHARQAIQAAKETQAKPLEAESVYALAEVQKQRGLFTDALNSFTQGSAMASDISNPELSWRFDFGRGEALQSLNRNTEALAAYQSAVKTIENVRSELREERFRAGYIEDKYQVYVALVQLLLKLNRVEEAFLVAERLRARSYLDMVNRGAPPIRNQTQREKESTLRSRIRELQKKLEDETAKPAPDQKRLAEEIYSKELTAAERDYEDFLDDISSSEPTYAAVRALKVPSGEEVRQQLKSDTALIEYVLSEQELVVFVITAEALHAKVIPVRNADIQSRTETLRDLMLRNSTGEWRLPAAALYQSLIGPIESENWLKGKTQLYVIPHSILHYVPFSALLKKNRPLINDYVVAYLPAAAALVQKNNTNPAGNSILAMAPANSQLQYTQLESEKVSNFFPKQHTLLLGARATESSFKRLADQFEFIHLATHGYFNKTNPLLSGLTLESDSIDDGHLEVHEIMGLRLKAKLVTLSACDTAVASGYFSDVPPGDDLVGLTRAFLSAGTTSVAASLWAINDRSAVNFMNSFYRQLQHKDRATALALAQRQMLLSGKYHHPYYWAAFVMVGQM